MSALALGLVLGLSLASEASGAVPPGSAPIEIAAEVTPVVFAVVIGHNASDNPAIADLHYADDDALATHALFLDAGIRSTLLVELDEDSRRVHPAARNLPAPTPEAVRGAFEAHRRQMKALVARGVPTELIVYFSGHGDVEGGEGHVVLSGGRLTRSALYHDILGRSVAGRNHVIIDACKSYYLAFAKGAGGTRTPHPGTFSRAVDPALLERTGFVLSTSSQRDSHEWSRFQAGIFSHEVRSALRGAADADVDGGISYSELGAFLVTANQAIDNPRFRPDFMVQPPGGRIEAFSQAVLRWPVGSNALLLDRPGLGHVYVEDHAGTRLADVHGVDGEFFALHLPPEGTLFVRRADESSEYVVGPASVRLSGLTAAAPAYRRKGAAHVAFSALFGQPFGAGQVRGYLAARQAVPTHLLTAAPEPPVRVRDWAPWVAGSAAVLGAGAHLLALQRADSQAQGAQADRARANGQIQALNGTAIGLYSVAGVAAVTWLVSLLVEDDGPPGIVRW